ncbi:MAG TPA: hypothetical protein PKD86_10785 [Gemmatales bacterium]|nr:hypothetical protein [Gemmatales bacterium]
MTMLHRVFEIAAAVLALAGAAVAWGDEQPVAGPTRAAAQQAALTATLRPLLQAALPTPLYQKSDRWGDTRPTPNGVKWRGQGLRVRPEVQFSDKNHGRWQRLRVEGQGLPDTLVFQVYNLHSPSPDRRAFEVFAGLPVRLIYEEQRWESGVRLYSTEVRARARVAVVLKCETRINLGFRGLMPDVALRLDITDLNVGYDGLSFEHVAGVGGEAAEQWGRLLVGVLRQGKPSIERDLRQRIEEALLRAVRKKELQVRLSQLWGA